MGPKAGARESWSFGRELLLQGWGGPQLTLACEQNCAVESWRSCLSLDLSLFIWELDAGAAVLGSKAGSAGSAKS